MAELKFKTRGMANPRGLPRVYFSCHPADFERYFETVSDEILKKQNCAIFYYEDLISYDKEQLFLDLAQMQLFVVPVTSNLLMKKSRAIDIEFKFAMENHIPVLPLMQESGLEELFSKRCGDLHFLDPNSRDFDALSYDEKLEKYLSSVLVSDELAAKVRAAFDAYVFLSYRKKDRKYAQELMRLIHKNDFCRDIAIWYDEFLTPGENFNDSIKDALKKSELFTLVVTPNLVNETNYVMTTEYPMAKQENKLILPAEIVETDRNLLKEKYAGIPDCIDAHNEPALTESLLKAVQTMAIKENDSSPEHNFFIGLAYLSGIDVEVDNERAVSLITNAAEAYLPEAMEKLVAMYRNGDGVPRNYETAIEWQEKYVEYLQAIYEKSNDEEDGYNLINEIWSLGAYCYELRKLQKAKAVYTYMLKISSELFDIIDSKRAGIYACFSCVFLGDTIRTAGKYEEASKCFLKSLEIVEQFAKETDLYEITSYLFAMIFERLGEIFEFRGSFDRAKEYYFKLFEIAEQIAKEKGTPESKRDLFVSYRRLGGIAESEHKFSEAKKYYLEGLRITEKLVTQIGTLEAKNDLSLCYANLGNIAKTESDFAEAKEYYYKAWKISEQLAKEIGTYETKRGLSVSYTNFGDLAKLQDNPSEAKKYYFKSFEIFKQLSEETDTFEARYDLFLVYKRLADISECENNFREAKEYYLKASEIAEQLAEEADIHRPKIELLEVYEILGKTAESKGKFSEAEKYYLMISETKKRMGAYFFDTAVMDLSLSYERLGNIALFEGELGKAGEYYFKSLKTAEELAGMTEKTGATDAKKHCLYMREAIEQISETDTSEGKRKLTIRYNTLGDTAKNKGRLGEAKKCFLRSSEIAEQLLNEDTFQGKLALLISYGRLSDIALAEGELSVAEQYYLKVHKLAGSDTYESKTDLLKKYEHLGDIAKSKGKFDEAKRYYLKVLEIFERLSEETGTLESKRNLSISYSIFGDVMKSFDDLNEANIYYHKALKIFEKLAEKTATTESYDDLAISYYKIGMLDEDNPSITLMKKAYDIYKILSENCPLVEKYSRNRDDIKSIIEQS